MIKEAALPDGIARSHRFDGLCENPFQSSNPIAEFNIAGQRHKQVQVIWKNDIAPDGDSEILLRASAKFDEGFMNMIVRQMRPAPIRAASDEIK